MNIVTKSEINVLIQLANADKHFADEERDLIFRIGHSHNYNDDEINELIGSSEPVDTLGALSPKQKLNYLLDCIELIFADGKVLESELSFCRGIALKMGLRRSVIDFIIDNRHQMTQEQLQEQIFSGFMF